MITVVGEALVDLIVAADGSVTATLGGAPYNAALAAARLGAPTQFAGALSTDRFGTLLAERRAADGVDIACGRRTGLPTTLAAAELDEHGGAIYRFYAVGTSAPDVPSGALDDLPGDDAMFFTGGLALVVEPMAATVIAHLRDLDRDTTVVIDVNARPGIVTDRGAYLANLVLAVGRADVVKVSEEDLAYLADDLTLEDLVAVGARVVVTAGASATTVHHECGVASVDVRRPVAPIVDTIGAGDTFVGALMAALTGALGTPARTRDELAGPAGLEALVAAVEVAHVAASIVVTRHGADPPTRDELLARSNRDQTSRDQTGRDQTR